MRIKITETKVYKFDELTEEQKDKVIEKHFDINIDYEWWNFVYDDAKQIGLKITEFDIDRGSYCKADFISGAMDTANYIIENHGDKTETYQDAVNYLKDRKELVVSELKKNEDDEDFTEDDIDFDDLDSEFLKTLKEDYLTILRKEYEYLTSREAIIETINANDYEFNEDGNIA